MKTHKLGSAPITDTEYAELLGNIGKLSEKDSKALGARARAYELTAALSEAENALASVFLSLSTSLGRSRPSRSFPIRLTSRSQLKRTRSRALMTQRRQRAGTLRLEQSGTANNGGLRIVELRPVGPPKTSLLAQAWRMAF